jgi:hypothetical protein
VNEPRAALAVGGASAAAVAVWLLAQILVTTGMGREAVDVALHAARALLLVQALAAALVVPLLARSAAPLRSLLVVQTVALPLLGFMWLIGVPARPLALGWAGVLLAAAALAVASRAVIERARGAWPRSVATVWLELGGAAAVWLAYPAWIRWLGL